MERAFYLFCLARADLLPELHMAGLSDDQPLSAEEYEGVAAILCEVPMDEFSGPSAEARMQELSWVGPKALRHGQVIEEIMQYSPVIPARFGTLFSSVPSLTQLLKHNLVQIKTFLDQAADREEWGIKGSISKARVKERLFSLKLASRSDELAAMSPGVRYFKERQIRSEVDKEMSVWLKRILKTVFDELSGVSAECRKREVRFPSLEGSDSEIVVNWAFFVERQDTETFKELVQRSNTENETSGLLFDLTGPWPPYSFSPTLDMEPSP